MDANCIWRCGRRIQSFNPRARDGRETTLPGYNRNLIGFNPRARDGREKALRSWRYQKAFQSTRP